MPPRTGGPRNIYSGGSCLLRINALLLLTSPPPPPNKYINPPLVGPKPCYPVSKLPLPPHHIRRHIIDVMHHSPLQLLHLHHQSVHVRHHAVAVKEEGLSLGCMSSCSACELPGTPHRTGHTRYGTRLWTVTSRPHRLNPAHLSNCCTRAPRASAPSPSPLPLPDVPLAALGGNTGAACAAAPRACASSLCHRCNSRPCVHQDDAGGNKGSTRRHIIDGMHHSPLQLLHLHHQSVHVTHHAVAVQEEGLPLGCMSS